LDGAGRPDVVSPGERSRRGPCGRRILRGICEQGARGPNPITFLSAARPTRGLRESRNCPVDWHTLCVRRVPPSCPLPAPPAIYYLDVHLQGNPLGVVGI
jgi:hypothetical protein